MANIGNLPLPVPLESVLAVGGSIIASARYSAIAVYTLCVYDWILSIADEYKLIWKAPLTTMKTAYLVCRYYPLLIFPVYLWVWLNNHSQDFCQRALHPLYGAITIFPVSAQAVVLMRTYAFTGRERKILYSLCACYLSLAGAEIWLFGYWFILESSAFQLFGKSGCFANDSGAVGLEFHYGSATASCVVLFAAFLMDVLMMGTVFMHCLRNRSFEGALGKFFVLQGFAAFVVMSALSLTAAITYAQTARQYDGVVMPFLLMVPDVLACRLILSLRKRVSPTESFFIKEQSRLIRDALGALELQTLSQDVTEVRHSDDWG
ncbi:hypothetical protein K435DRAFT_238694 [Dendrothele bispora CBS 962.96]|uniref:DUF6533 domain-containing protein n=1 Tax=Dendrothele bispora (strain CBS 962.96) TaxID=1314807 RepID=A0A4S8MLT4_DENBC|nr:hypothetical protein K435DRAFT_238694 [Dendrothele bispora CBS 962.96]